MIELIEDLPHNVVGIAVKGRVTKEECRKVLLPAMTKALRWRDHIRLYYELGSRFPGSGWDDLDLGFEQAACCERIAIVSDIAWVRLTVKAIRFLIPGEIRVFGTLETDAARAWITARSETRATPIGAQAGAFVSGRSRTAKRLTRRSPVPPPAIAQPPAQSRHSYVE